MGDDESTEYEEEYAQGMNKSTVLFSDSMEEESDNDYLHHTESQSYTVPGGQDEEDDEEEEKDYNNTDDNEDEDENKNNGDECSL